MDTAQFALMVEQEHNEIDCCPLHLAIFDQALTLIGAGHGWAPAAVLN